MLKGQSHAITAALLAALLASSAMAAGEQEQKLIDVLESNAPPAQKAVPCKQLAIYGTKAAVPALAKLLADEDLASWARIALEAIPDSSADDALRAAVGKLNGRLLIGTINSIGVRRDPKAVSALIGKLKDSDVGVASAAAAALGRIGGPEAVKALEQCLTSAPPAVSSTAAHGCVRCAERFLAEGEAEQAVRLCDMVRKANVPLQRKREATRGAILARGPEGVPMLVEQLRSADKAWFGLGLRVARELPGPEATAAVAAELGKLTPVRQTFLIYALADRGDAKALPAVLAAAKSGPAAVRVVALGALEDLGNASCVPVLLIAAGEGDAAIVKAAKAALARLPGDDVDAALLAHLPKASGKAREALIVAIAARNAANSLPAIEACLGDADAGVRAAAIAAIGALGTETQVARLAALLQKTSDRKEQAAIDKALRAIGVRTGAACVPRLLPLAKSDASAVRIVALHALACAGGADALAAVAAAVNDKEAAVQDEAARTLSTWPNNWPDDPAVAGPLLALAQSSKKVTHQVLALRGYLEYVRGATKLNPDAKVAKLDQALPLLKRHEEKRLAISVLATIRNRGSLERLVALTKDKPIAEEACATIVNLLRRGSMAGVSKDQRRTALQAVVDTSKSARTKKMAADLLKRIR